MKNPLRSLGALAVAGTLALSACGGSSSTGSAGGAAGDQEYAIGIT